MVSFVIRVFDNASYARSIFRLTVYPPASFYRLLGPFCNGKYGGFLPPETVFQAVNFINLLRDQPAVCDDVQMVSRC